MAHYRIYPSKDGDILVTGVRMRGKSLDKRVQVKIEGRDDLEAAITSLLTALYPERGPKVPPQAMAGKDRVGQ